MLSETKCRIFLDIFNFFLQNWNFLVSGRLVGARSGRAGPGPAGPGRVGSGPTFILFFYLLIFYLIYFIFYFYSCLLTFAITYSDPYLA